MDWRKNYEKNTDLNKANQPENDLIIWTYM